MKSLRTLDIVTALAQASFIYSARASVREAPRFLKSFPLSFAAICWAGFLSNFSPGLRLSLLVGLLLRLSFGLLLRFLPPLLQ
jgi:hypothetical protein